MSKFDEADIEPGSRIKNKSFSSESFENIDAAGSRFERVRFSDRDFTETGFDWCGFKDCIFFKCVFDSTNMARTLFHDCEFMECTFCCYVGSVRFKGCDFYGCDMSDASGSETAIFDDCTVDEDTSLPLGWSVCDDDVLCKP